MTSYNSKTVQDRCIVSSKVEKEIVCALYRIVMLPLTFGDPYILRLPFVSSWSVTSNLVNRDLVTSRDQFKIFNPPKIYLERLKLKT